MGISSSCTAVVGGKICWANLSDFPQTHEKSLVTGGRSTTFGLHLFYYRQGKTIYQEAQLAKTK